LSQLIARTVSTHQDGDGIIYVTLIDTVINIQTGQTDEAELVAVS
jgi:nitrogen regulatory protein PII